MIQPKERIVYRLAEMLCHMNEICILLCIYYITIFTLAISKGIAIEY